MKGRHANTYAKTLPNEQPMAGKPTAPPHLKGLAKSTFERVAETLNELGIISRADVDMLEQYAVNYARYVEAEKLVSELGLTQDFRGYKRNSPWITISNECQRTMREILKELALTPAARKRLEVTGEQKENSITKFLKKAE